MSLVSRLLDCSNDRQMAKVFRQVNPDQATVELRELLAQADWVEDYGEPDAEIPEDYRQYLQERPKVAYEERVIVELEDEASALMSGFEDPWDGDDPGQAPGEHEVGRDEAPLTVYDANRLRLAEVVGLGQHGLPAVVEAGMFFMEMAAGFEQTYKRLFPWWPVLPHEQGPRSMFVDETLTAGDHDWVVPMLPFLTEFMAVVVEINYDRRWQHWWLSTGLREVSLEGEPDPERRLQDSGLRSVRRHGLEIRVRLDVGADDPAGCDGVAMARTLVAESIAVCARKIGAAPPPPLPLRSADQE